MLHTHGWGTVKTLYQGFPNRRHKNAREALENAREASEDPACLNTYKCGNARQALAMRRNI